MPRPEIPDSAIEAIARHINDRSNKNHGIPTVGNEDNLETPQIFEIAPFDEIDSSDRRFYAIDGSYNSEQFYNGLCIAAYAAGYVCYQRGERISFGDSDDPVAVGKSYYPEHLLVTGQEDLYAIYDELFTLVPVRRLLEFWDAGIDELFPFSRDQICTNLSTLLGFCQEVMEIALILEIAELDRTKAGDFVLRDGTLRPLQVKQAPMVRLGRYLHERGIVVVAITKQSPVKMELSYCFKQIDSYLQDQLKPRYPFREIDPRRKKLCCWFEVPDAVLAASYQGTMYAKKAIMGGRGFGLFFAARLDYVEKLQNYDWLIADLNILDIIPGIDARDMARDSAKARGIFYELTRLTQEHYILGYPYPLAEAHNFISLKSDFKEEIVARLKYTLYREQMMDHVDIENLFLDFHDRF